MRLSDERYEEIKEEVVHMLIQNDVKCIPISGFEIASRLGISVIPYSSLTQKKLTAARMVSDSGFYFEPGDGSEKIYYNDISTRYERQNWTILHEVGHAVLGHPDSMNHDEAEAEANFFAKYAAAPPPLVHHIHPRCAEDIMDEFQLSHEAAVNAYTYYLKWLRHGGGRYTIYEMDLLHWFQIIS